MKTFLSLLALTFAVGCSSITPSVVRLGVGTGVAYGVQKYPEALPEVKIAAEVICSAAHGTDISPTNIVAAIRLADPNISTDATLIVNGALVLYIGVWNSYGASAVNNNPKIRPYLEATCDGLTDVLATAGRRSFRMRSPKDWPLVKPIVIEP